jgi:hypothetical protein
MHQLKALLSLGSFLGFLALANAAQTYPLYPGQSLSLSDGSQVVCIGQTPIPPPPPPVDQVTCQTDRRPSGLLYTGTGRNRWEALDSLMNDCLLKQQFVEPVRYNCQKYVVDLATCR